MNKSIVSLCQKWQTYQLPQWTEKAEPSVYAQHMEKIAPLLEELAAARAYLQLLHIQRDQLVRRAIYWVTDPDSKDVEYCWHCLIDGYSFSRQDAAQVMKTLKTFFFKENQKLSAATTDEQPGVERLASSELINLIMKLPDRYLNWKLAYGFQSDLTDQFKALEVWMRSRLDTREAIQHQFRDLTEYVSLVLEMSEDKLASLTEPRQKVAQSMRSVLLKPVATEVERHIAGKQEADTSRIISAMHAHFRRVEVNLNDYLLRTMTYQPDEEITQNISEYRRWNTDWREAAQPWHRFMSVPEDRLPERITEALGQAASSFNSQLKTLERIRRRALDRGIIDKIVDSARVTWLYSEA